METVMLDGREYTKASIVAKRFNYTSDYLGQLCRGKKIDARVIGRTWFLNIDSLEGHRSQKYASLKKPQVPNELTKNKENEQSGIAPKQYIKRVSMPLRGVNRILTAREGRISEGAKEVDVSYEPDESSLLPTVQKISKVTQLRVSPAGAERLNVKSSGFKTSILTPEPLPEVYLNGSLSISDATDEIEEAEDISESRDNIENKDENDTAEQVEHLGISQKTPRTLKVTIKRLDTKPEEKTQLKAGASEAKLSTAMDYGKYAYSVAINKSSAASNELTVKDLEHAPSTGSALPITVMVCSAVVMSVVLLSVVNIITVTTSSYNSTFEFQASLLLAFLHL